MPGKTRILLIDDDTCVRELLKIALETEGYQVDEASNGQDGIELYKNEPYDLIITDIFMPEKDGVDLIIDLTDEYSGIKIIVLSGGSNPAWRSNYQEDAIQFGAKAALLKPVSTTELISAVKEVLDS